jgi:hypothetical protein
MHCPTHCTSHHHHHGSYVLHLLKEYKGASHSFTVQHNTNAWINRHTSTEIGFSRRLRQHHMTHCPALPPQERLHAYTLHTYAQTHVNSPTHLFVQPTHTPLTCMHAHAHAAHPTTSLSQPSRTAMCPQPFSGPTCAGLGG